MFSPKRNGIAPVLIGTAVLALVMCGAPFATAQPRDLARIEGGTQIPVRTTERIDERSLDGRVFSGVVDDDVPDATGRVAIRRGSAVELVVRQARDGDLILDLDSIIVDGQRYAVRADKTRVDAGPSSGDGRRTAEYAGGGALLGTIIGAVTGGGKGAAIGAAAGAAAGAGAGVLTRGHEIRVPEETLVMFRLERPLDVGVPDDGYDRDQHHYHRYQQ